jgi:DNA-binding NarL/FixJ family response regulator
VCRGVASSIGTAARVAENAVAMATTVLIVDDHAAFRVAARRVLERAGYEVVAAAADGETALRAVADLRPDVVVLDVQMPGIDGFEVAARLSEAGDAPAIVLISSRDSADFGGLVGASGARGFILKDELSGPALAALLI